jgi:hypothetical protein
MRIKTADGKQNFKTCFHFFKFKLSSPSGILQTLSPLHAIRGFRSACYMLYARLDLFKKLGMIWKDRSNCASTIYEKICEIICTESARFLKQEIREFPRAYITLLSAVVE